MAGYNSSNPFYTDEDEKESFGKHHYNTGTSGSGNPFESEEDNRKNQVLSQIHESEDRQLESTRRMVMSIDESEKVGVATAEVIIAN
jgi:TFIIF-interacting CTD phosphatase-like protein